MTLDREVYYKNYGANFLAKADGNICFAIDTNLFIILEIVCWYNVRYFLVLCTLTHVNSGILLACHS